MKKFKFIMVILMLIGAVLVLNAQEKSLERLGNEAANAGDELYNAGSYIEAGKKYEEALDLFRQAKEKDNIPVEDKIVQMLKNMLSAYYNGKDYAKAISIIEEQQKMKPKDYDLAKKIAHIYEKDLNDRQMAIATLKKFDDKYPSYKCEKKIANHYIKLDDLESALIWFEKAFKIKEDASVLKNIATIYVKLGNTPKAINAYETFINKGGHKESVLVKVYKNLGAMYEELGKVNKATDAYEKSINYKYNELIATKLMLLYYENKNYSKANSKISQLLKRDSRDSNAIYHRALIKYNTGDKAGAKSDFQLLTADDRYGKSSRDYLKSIESE